MALCASTWSRIAHPWTWKKKCCLTQWMHGKGPSLCTLSCPGSWRSCSGRSFWLSFPGDPDFSGRNQSLDLMQITPKDYDNIDVSSIHHPRWRRLEGVKEMYQDTRVSFLCGCIDSFMDCFQHGGLDHLRWYRHSPHLVNVLLLSFFDRNDENSYWYGIQNFYINLNRHNEA